MDFMKEMLGTYQLYQWILLFFVYSFLGWVYESLYVSVRMRKWVNRGFMVGPMLPLYGSGAIVMLIVSMPFRDNLILVYCSGCVGATLLEYVTGVAMEKLFRVRYWDYTGKRFNFQGHICAQATLLWGVFTVVMVKWINPPIAGVVLGLDERMARTLVSCLSLIAISDYTYSFKAAMDLRVILTRLEEAKREVENLRRRIEILAAFAEDSRHERFEELAEQLDRLRGERMEKRREGIDRIENFMENRLEGIREQLEELKTREYLRTVLHGEENNRFSEELEDAKIRFAVFRERYKEVRKQYSFGIRNLLRGNPGAISKEDASLIEELRSLLERGKRK